ncbi:MAG TPA: cyclase family protein [Myxococcota bacterium]|nr:cyclase family protein [Myxococcota bacterium]
MRTLACAVALLAVAACARPLPREELVDLTHPFDASTIYWPTEESFVLEGAPGGVTEGGYYYEAHRFRAAEHGGTHLDAPIHLHAGGEHVDEIPLEHLVAPGVVIDVQAACFDDRDHEIGVADLQAWEKQNGEIPRGGIVLFYTGTSRYWPDREAYLGTTARGQEAVSSLHFPGLGADAARWLIAERGVVAVGIDTASIDRGPSRRFETHQTLFAANVPAFENVAALELLPPRGFRIAALPMKIGGGSGAPLRIVAFVPRSSP